MTLQTRYKVKGIGSETTINSHINIFHNNGKITKVEDKWDGKLPESGISKVSPLQLLWPLWWLRLAVTLAKSWLFWIWHFFWETWIWRVRGVFSCLKILRLPGNFPGP